MDSRLIRDFKHYTVTEEQKRHLIPIAFHLKNDQSEKEYLGVVAEQLQVAEPLLVKKNVQGWSEVDYPKLTVLLLAMVKELEDRVLILENNGKRRK